jgi:hypothetical protein
MEYNMTQLELKQMKALQDTEKEAHRAVLEQRNKLAANAMLVRMLASVAPGESSLASEVAEAYVGVSIYE